MRCHVSSRLCKLNKLDCGCGFLHLRAQDGASVDNCTVHSWSIGNLAYLYVHGLPDRISITSLNATFAVEEALRTSFTTASSLPCRGAPFFACPPIAGQAALFGQRKKAADLLRLAWFNYTLPPYHMMREYSHYNFGMYILRPLGMPKP